MQSEQSGGNTVMVARVRLHRIVSDPVTLHFSPGYRERARRLGELVAEAHRFLAGWLAVEEGTTLSVLRREAWRRLRRAPYGYPHSNPERATIYAPANYTPRLIERARALYDAASPELQHTFCPDPARFAEEIRRFYDLVAVHELGHLFIHHLRLGLGTRWLTELVSNLFATAFFLEERPDLARCWLAWAHIQASTDVAQRSLELYEQQGNPPLDFATASYYQGRFNLMAHRIWQSQGRAVAPALITHFSLKAEPVRQRFALVAPEFDW